MSHQRRGRVDELRPAPGKIGRYREPSGAAVRVDSGVGPGSEISPMYDPMVAKLIVWDADRAEATKRVLRALHEYEIEGLTTLIPFHKALLATEEWAQGSTCRELLEDKEWLKTLAREPIAGAADEGAGETVEQTYTVEVSGKRFDVTVIGSPAVGSPARLDGGVRAAASARKPRRAERNASAVGGADTLPSPLQGNMWKVLVKQGDTVEHGQPLCIIEAMKMENEITAHKAGVIADLPISEGAPIRAGDPIAVTSSGDTE